MATLIHPDMPATHRPAAARQQPLLVWCLRTWRAGWEWACQHAERPDRVVPYY